jgi:hypothetical protein
MIAMVIRRPKPVSSEELHEALFAKRPRKRSLRKLKAGLRQAVRKRHARD